MAYGLIAMIGTIVLEQNVSLQNSNPCNLMTLDNEVMICDNVYYNGQYIADTTLFTLSDSSMFPSNNIQIPINVITQYGTQQDICTINTSGEISVNNNYFEPLFLFDGIKWHVNNKYYTPTIGNIYNNGTSPLSEGY